ncbi:hypothetical protein [Cryptosporangium minutisporangium]|uniref:Lipoprotein n=1 Tax=Cryptosporangium minutisporangium TaxID=113569 RepID=A0ABP6T0B1_9ACTN
MINRRTRPARWRLLGTAVSVVVALSACGSPENTPRGADETPHGYVEGAQELPEPQSAIAYASRGSERLQLLDLTTQKEKDVELSLGAQRIAEDGRFVYVDDGDRRLEIVDSGVWTVDHTDHVHYYRAPARSVGVVSLDAAIDTITGSEAHTTIGTADGRITVLDRRKLQSGDVAELSTIDTRSSTPLAVPYADALLVALGDDPGRPANRIVAMDARGTPTGALDVPCAAPRGWAVLRGGAVIACETTVVRVKRQGDRLAATAVAAPEAPIPPDGLAYRPRSNEAAVADRTGIWSVNAAKATVRYVPAGDRRLVAAASPADGDTVLALDESGALTSYDVATGKALATASVLGSPSGASLTLDINRAYVAEPEARVIREIDYRDGLRTARTFRASERPDLAVEVGR